MTTLHLLNKPPEHGRFQRCLEAIGTDDTLVLIEAAVAAVTLDRPWPAQTLALGSDLQARGLASSLPAQIKAVDAEGLVSLTAAHASIISW